MHFGLNNPNRAYTVNIVAIASECSIKNLCGYISDTLSWREHIFKITKKASRVAHVILHVFNGSSHDIDLYMRAFDAYVKSMLEYCSYAYEIQNYVKI